MQTPTQTNAARVAGQIKARLAPVGAIVEQDGIQYRIELREGSGHAGGKGSRKWMVKLGSNSPMDEYAANNSLVTIVSEPIGTSPATTGQNEREFVTIGAAISALEKIESLIEDIRNDFQNAKSDTEARVDGWQETENFGDFADAMFSHDKELLRKLVNLGLCL